MRKGNIRNRKFQLNERVDFLPGSCLLIKNSALKDTGLFNQEFDLYGMEDVEYTLRAKSKGHQSLFVPKAEVCHLADYSFFDENKEKTYFVTRNRLLLGKYCTESPFEKICFFMAFVIRWFCIRSLSLILRGKFSCVVSIFRGTMDGMKIFFTSESKDQKT